MILFIVLFQVKVVAIKAYFKFMCFMPKEAFYESSSLQWIYLTVWSPISSDNGIPQLDTLPPKVWYIVLNPIFKR